MARERNAEDSLGDSVNKFRERVEENVDKLRGQAEEMRDRIEEATDSVRIKGKDVWKDAVKMTQKQPAQAIGLAILAGAALGILLISGRRR